MSYTAGEERIVLPNRETLGRSAWTDLHTRADSLKDGSLPEFVQFARLFVSLYPCSDCRTKAQTACRRHLEALSTLAEKPGAARTVAVAWASRFHACVTLHLPLQRDTLSRRLALEVDRLWRAHGDASDAITVEYIDSMTRA